MDLTDKEYVERCRDGRPEEFRLLVERYQKPLFAYLVGKLRDRRVAEEAAQETMVRAFLSLKSLHKPESFYAWLLGIANRVALEQFRESRRQQMVQDDVEALSAEATATVNDESLAETISVLPESYRRVILLRYFHELSCQEIAEELGMPLNTVTKTLSRAYALLRQELSAREGKEQTINPMKP